MIAVAGAAIVFARLPSERAGFSRSFASGDLTKRMRAGLQLALVGGIFASSQTARSTVSLTGFACQRLWVRASRKRRSSAASPRIFPIDRPLPPVLPNARDFAARRATRQGPERPPGRQATSSDRPYLLHLGNI